MLVCVLNCSVTVPCHTDLYTSVNYNNTVGACGFVSLIAPFLYPVTLIKVDEDNNIVRDSHGVCVKAKPGESWLCIEHYILSQF